jgi:ornithine cyclodeaminase/alanine dehydrogenase-like protein (mu-crystallin family)
MLILTASDVQHALPMKAAIQAMKQAYASLSAGKAEIPLRTRLDIQPQNGVCLFMPAYVQTQEGDALAVKVVSLFPNNPERGLAFIQAAVLIFEPDTGRLLAILEGSALTAIRTGAASGAAIDILARPESKVVAIFGAGAQARTQLEAACLVRSIEQVWVFDLSFDKAQSFAREMAGKQPVPADLQVAETPQQAIADADIICTATTSNSPVFADEDLKPGTHISAVGSYTPEMQEISSATLARARVVVDSRIAALAETGDLIQPIQSGIFGEDHIYAELGEIVLGNKPGRNSPEQITVFKSVGVAVQDAVAAQVTLQNAQVLGLGTDVNF